MSEEVSLEDVQEAWAPVLAELQGVKVDPTGWRLKFPENGRSGSRRWTVGLGKTRKGRTSTVLSQSPKGKAERARSQYESCAA